MPNGDHNNHIDQIFFERDAIAFQLMEAENGLLYEDAVKKADEIIRKQKHEEENVSPLEM